MNEQTLLDTIESLEWMIQHFKWAHDQTGLGGSYSPELRKAIETLDKLKNEAVKQ